MTCLEDFNLLKQLRLHGQTVRLLEIVAARAKNKRSFSNFEPPRSQISVFIGGQRIIVLDTITRDRTRH